uniref:Uncharacterized protein n=1 Tax=Moniliophthora roreri TaxID=221103 RepID=A0A0W0FN84_MONRR
MPPDSDTSECSLIGFGVNAVVVLEHCPTFGY